MTRPPVPYTSKRSARITTTRARAVKRKSISCEVLELTGPANGGREHGGDSFGKSKSILVFAHRRTACRALFGFRDGSPIIASNRTWLKAYWDDAHAFWNASKPLENPDTLIAMWFDVCGPSGGLFAKTKCTDFEPFISFALHERCKLIDVIFRFQEDIFGAVFPILQKIGRIILVGILLNQNGNHILVTLKRSIKWYEYYADAL